MHDALLWTSQALIQWVLRIWCFIIVVAARCTAEQERVRSEGFYAVGQGRFIRLSCRMVEYFRTNAESSTALDTLKLSDFLYYNFTN